MGIRRPGNGEDAGGMRMSALRLSTPVLVIGTGLAGCSAALTLADQGLEVTLVSAETDPAWCNSSLAQGGIVYTSAKDSPALLGEDMQVAGWRQNYGRAVRRLAKEGPRSVDVLLLERLQVPFARKESGDFDLAREGGHSTQRILHCADYTGKAIMEAIQAALRASPNVRLLQSRTAVDLLTTHHHATHLDYRYGLPNTCMGAYLLNSETNQVETILAEFTVLATGGAGQVFLHSTNTRGSIGSALAMGFRAGARIFNAEYVQFHPTALYRRAERRFLISEAVRGEGAKLVGTDGKPFMQRYDARADLAPRDIVTRAIMEELLRTGEDCVYLDVANYVKQDLPQRFPTIFKTCMDNGIDMRQEPIPVVPAAHYTCGGILTDLMGRTTLERLYAVGECSCTGIHGANRLASTSLLECLVWGKSAGEDIARRLHKRHLLTRKLKESIPDWRSPGEAKNEDPALLAQDWARIRNTMWNYVGITRTTSRLRRAFEELRNLDKNLHDFYRETPLSKPLLDLFHGCQAARSITLSAMLNTRSLGCHYRVD